MLRQFYKSYFINVPFPFVFPFWFALFSVYDFCNDAFWLEIDSKKNRKNRIQHVFYVKQTKGNESSEQNNE